MSSTTLEPPVVPPADGPGPEDSRAVTSAEGPTRGGVVLFRLGSARYALPMAEVAEVGRWAPPTRVPGAPDWVAGLANWRGRVLPVLDLRRLLGAPTAPADTRTRLIVLTTRGFSAGVLADSVDGVRDDLPEKVGPPPATLDAAAAALLGGTYLDDDVPVGLLDVAVVLRLRETLPRARRG
jgi:purine-binding chemotaxis protein CheW